MPVDTSTTIAGFDTAKPALGDPKLEGPANFQHIKGVLKNNLAGINGTVTATHTELSHVSGVTSPIQTQLDGKAALASPAFTGTPTVPTAAPGTNTTQAASTAYTQAAIAAVNASSGNLTRSTSAAASFSVSAGQLVASTYSAGPVAVTFPASPTVGQAAGVAFDNGRIDNTVDLGTNSVIGPSGVPVSGVVTINVRMPIVWAWFGDYWRAA